METYKSLHNHDYFESQSYREEIFRKIFCDFEHYVWDWSIEFLQKVHDFCEYSAQFSDIADKIYYAQNTNNYDESLSKDISDFMESLIPHLYINTHLENNQNKISFSQKEISYMRKKLLAFIYSPHPEIIEQRKKTKNTAKCIVLFQSYQEKRS